MNIQKVFDAVEEEPDQHTLITAVLELEQQGYRVVIAEKYRGSDELVEAEENDELNYLPTENGVLISIMKENESQQFRIHFLDIDKLAITSVESSPVAYKEDCTIGFYQTGKNN